MHDTKDICARPDFYKEKLGHRGVEPELIDQILVLRKEQTRIAREAEDLQAEINKVVKDIGKAKSKGVDCTELLQYAETLKALMPLAKEGKLEAFIEEMKGPTPNEFCGRLHPGDKEEQ